MIYLYCVWVLFTGYTLAATLFFKSEELEARLAIMPLLGVLLPALILYFLNSIKIPFTPSSLWMAWVACTAVFWGISWRFRVPQADGKKFSLFLRTLPKLQKIFILLLILGLIGLYARIAMNETWPGDGFSHWGMKARYWLHHQSISYSDFEIMEYKHWMSYPLYHSLGMLVHMLALPFWPPSYSCHLNDAFYMIGAWTTAIFFFKLVMPELKAIWRIFWGSVVAFGSRELMGLLIAGYAEIDSAYFIFLSATLLLLAWQFPQRKNAYVALGFPIGAAMITRPDLTLKMALLFFAFFMVTWFSKKGRRPSYSLFPLLLIPTLFLWAIDKLSRPDVSYLMKVYNQFFDYIVWDISYIVERLPKGVMAFYYSFATSCEGPHKCSFTLALLIVALSLVLLVAKTIRAKLKGNFGQIALFLLLAISLNYLLCFVPIVALNNHLEPSLDDPRYYASAGMGRYVLHVNFLLNALVAMVAVRLYAYYKNLFYSDKT
ncbi:MAG: hypothetical protein HQK50_05550 [Oligoflexia bacterium]|nr:hypothetical protein [Oligoflexia bacterium]